MLFFHCIRYSGSNVLWVTTQKFDISLPLPGTRPYFLLSAEPPSPTGPRLHRLHNLHFKTPQNTSLFQVWEPSQNDQGSGFTPHIPARHFLTFLRSKVASHSWLLPGDCLHRLFLLNDASQVASVIANDSEKRSWIQASRSPNGRPRIRQAFLDTHQNVQAFLVSTTRVAPAFEKQCRRLSPLSPIA